TGGGGAHRGQLEYTGELEAVLGIVAADPGSAEVHRGDVAGSVHARIIGAGRSFPKMHVVSGSACLSVARCVVRWPSAPAPRARSWRCGGYPPENPDGTAGAGCVRCGCGV